MTEIAYAHASRRTAPGHTVIAVLGPTNTGKTHLAIERMLGHQSGLIGLPLRLLAREVYDKIVTRVGEANVALITGEEKIKPERARYWVCTVEAMPRDIDVEFLAIDEIQLAADPERGHVFTERLLTARGLSETLLLGSSTMEGLIRDLLPGANFINRHRLSKLTYAGQKKLTRLPRRSAIVAFSASDVYAVAELIRRQRGGAAVVLGALSPRTRNAQVELYQSGDVDFLVATDAIGMGLNLALDHVAFAGSRKFDGVEFRDLIPQELGQIAGRAGRHLNDGTFGVTAEVQAFDSELINKLENHEFEPVKILHWRNTDLDFSSLDRLKESLRETPSSQRLTRARAADDVIALDTLSADARIRDIAIAPAAIKSLWELCQLPDYRKISSASHAELIGSIYRHLMSDEGVIPEDWFASQVALADRTDGDIDTLSNRIAHIRTWTFVSNRLGWLANADHWRDRTRAIEDSLSDALHELLTQRFVDRRTSVLMKSMRDKNTLYADIEKSGQIYVEKHYVGKLEGFHFTPDSASAGVHGKAARHAAAKVLAVELSERAGRLCGDKDEHLSLSRTGAVSWRNQEIGRIEPGDAPLQPNFVLTADEHLNAQDRERIVKRVNDWLTAHIAARIKPLVELSKAQDLTGLARGVAFQIVENFGILRREKVAEDIRSLDQQARGELRKYGVRFGAYNIYLPLLLKPAAADLLLLLWALKHGASVNIDPANLPEPPRQGLTSVPLDKDLPEAFYAAAGFQSCGSRAIRVDMLERLADQIRPLVNWRPAAEASEPPPGAAGKGAFKIQPEMLSIIGCSSEEMGNVLFALGFRMERRPISVKPAATESGVVAADSAASQENEPAAEGGAEPGADAIPAEAEAAVLPSVADEVSAATTEEANNVSTAPVDAVETSPEQEAGAAAAPEAEISPEETADAEAATPAEPDYEEIWRPRRRAQSDERRQTRRRGDGRSAEGAGQQQPRRQRRDGAGQGQATEAKAAEGGQERPAARRDRRKDGERGNRNRNGPPRGNDKRGQGKPRHEPLVKSAAPPKGKQAAADKDSPFAALLELKERMSRETQDQA
jgi:ATP-dependent RNA helicase SUPV3L1/SUV3